MDKNELTAAYAESCLALRNAKIELDKIKNDVERNRKEAASFARQMKLCIIYLSDSLEEAGGTPKPFCIDYVTAFRKDRALLLTPLQLKEFNLCQNKTAVVFLTTNIIALVRGNESAEMLQHIARGFALVCHD